MNVTEPIEDLFGSIADTLSEAVPLAPMTAGQQAAAAGRLLRGLLTSPVTVARKTAELGAALAEIAVGRSDVVPEPGDRRFAHEAWNDNPFYKRLGQSYLAWRKSVYDLIEEIEPNDTKAQLRGRFLAALAVEAVAPTNALLGNPAAMEAALNSGGRTLIDGARHALWSLRHNGGLPAMVDTRPFVAGETIATTPGAVVFRSDVLELIQYTPADKKVHSRPLVIVPPQINKFYILDLAPGRSLVEYAVSRGQQVFMISWRNPTPEMRSWDLDTYVDAISDALDAALEITGSADCNIMGVCAGGITTASLLGNLAATGDERVNAVTFLVTVLDWDIPSTVASLTSAPSVAASIAQANARGIVDGGELSRFFAWMRPNDLVWNYWVNNFLMGKNPPAFDVLAWNVDSTNLPAGLHEDFTKIAADNALTKAGELVVKGDPVDLSHVKMDAYIVGAETDHITPWQGCYRTAHLLGGNCEFVLSSSGHVQVMVNPPDNPKARYFTNPVVGNDAEEWLESATEQKGSWWVHWADWLGQRSGALRNARAKLGSAAHPVIEAAPGTYVKETA
ncbi:MAG: alpha/beta fold hydrolase [Acidimicrobiales bacterium]